MDSSGMNSANWNGPVPIHCVESVTSLAPAALTISAGMMTNDCDESEKFSSRVARGITETIRKL
jgi:hypothetical protein